ncbi:hypothetical protein FB471_3784 [Amycolatopsis cihanbeyliensis]|uniref:Uncharacterized protein n=1 Tax=Amycolatopsis cihanbeyliensis TaxID=1128664 RepID=A0A542DLP4_AMYCI|nr:hypothetical protein FB471_3784 [Amycolatopsis cihanbeyliensis]
MRVVVSFAFIAIVLVLAPLAISIYGFAQGQPGMGRYALAFAVVCALVLWVGYETRLRRHTSTGPLVHRPGGPDTAALEIPYSTRIYTGYLLVMTAVALVFVMAAVDSFASDDPGRVGGGYVYGGVAMLFGSLPALMATGRFRRGYLRLTPEGAYQRGWTFESFLRWSSIVAVLPKYADCPVIVVVAEDDAPWQRRQITRLWRQDRLPKVKRQDGNGLVPMLDIPGKFLSVDPTLVYYLLGFYLTNPSARVELGSESAVRRARSGALG